MSCLELPVSSCSSRTSHRSHIFWCPKCNAQNNKRLCFYLHQSKKKAVCFNWMVTGDLFSCKKIHTYIYTHTLSFKTSLFFQSAPHSHLLLGWPLFINRLSVTLFKIKCYSQSQGLCSHLRSWRCKVKIVGAPAYTCFPVMSGKY